MQIELRPRTEQTVAVYFEKAHTPEILKTLPQKAKTLEEALADFRRTQLPESTSYGLTIWKDDAYVGDIWCYGIDLSETPNAMVSYCIFDISCRGQGAATQALHLFVEKIRKRFSLQSLGAFTYCANAASIRVLEKNSFVLKETFCEDNVESAYYQLG